MKNIYHSVEIPAKIVVDVYDEGKLTTDEIIKDALDEAYSLADFIDKSDGTSFVFVIDDKSRIKVNKILL